MSKRSRSNNQNDHEGGHNRRKKPHNNPESNNNDDQNDRNQPNNPRNPQDSSNDKPYDIPKKPPGIYEYLISYKQLEEKLRAKKLHPYKIQGTNTEIYFPHPKPNDPQKNFLRQMFTSLNSPKGKRNLIIESSTGTGKTLSLLYGSMAWAQNYYMQKMKQINEKWNKKEMTQLQFEQAKLNAKIKIIYTSRAHTQLDQISKQLEKTPFRPNVLLFGSRGKLCINDIITDENNCEKQIGGYEQWDRKCITSNIYQRMSQHKDKKQTIYQSIIQTKKTLLNILEPRPRKMKQDQYKLARQQSFKYLKKEIKEIENGKNNIPEDFNSKQNREFTRNGITHLRNLVKLYENHQSWSLGVPQITNLRNSFELLVAYQSRCPHFSKWNSGKDSELFRKISRYPINSQYIKAKGKQYQVCSYHYPKRVKNWGNLYLMPYNYILDELIVEKSMKIISNSIVIFDEGHNVPDSACQGFSFCLRPSLFDAAIDNINEKDEYEKKNGKKQRNNQDQRQDLQRQDALQQIQDIQEQIEIQELQQNNLSNRQNRISKLGYTPEQEKSYLDQQKELQNWLTQIISKHNHNFISYFSKDIIDPNYKLCDYQQKRQDINKVYFKSWQEWQTFDSNNRKKSFAEVNKIMFNDSQLTLSTIKDYLLNIIDKLKIIIIIKQIKNQIMQKQCEKTNKFFKPIYYLKIVRLQHFYSKLLKFFTDKDYLNKFYIKTTQFMKNIPYKDNYLFKGQLKITCVSAEFSMKKLQAYNPYSIIVTSGTLEPLDLFKGQLKITFRCAQPAGYVITDKNLCSRVLTHFDDQKDIYITNDFWGKSSNLNKQDIDKLWDALTKTIQNIPNGILVMVSSKKVLYKLRSYYRSFGSKRMGSIDPEKFIEFQIGAKLQQTINKFKQEAKTERGALMFCVSKGKLSEGIDFTDKLCRAVIFLGMPFLNKYSPSYRQKTAYMNQFLRRFQNSWSLIQVSKSINQALGRAIRHKNDFGAIILFDIRYNSLGKQNWQGTVVNHISKWITDKWKVVNTTKQLADDLKQFYEKSEDFFIKNGGKQQVQQREEQEEKHQPSRLSNRFNELIEQQQILPNQINNMGRTVSNISQRLRRQQQQQFLAQQQRIQTRMSIQQSPDDQRIQNYKKLISQRINPYNLEIRPTSDKGYCLYQCISFFKTQSTTNWPKIKKEILAHIKRKRNNFYQILMKNKQLDSEDFDAGSLKERQALDWYVNRMQPQNQRAGQIQIRAASSLYGMGFIVHKDTGFDKPIFQRKEALKPQNLFHLAQCLGINGKNDHYVILKPKKNFTMQDINNNHFLRQVKKVSMGIKK